MRYGSVLKLSFLLLSGEDDVLRQINLVLKPLFSFLEPIFMKMDNGV